MFPQRLLLILLATLSLAGCGEKLRSQERPKWAAGYWFWRGSENQPAPLLDVLFVQVGNLYERNSGSPGDSWSASGRIPGTVPAAREYWFVYRFDRQKVPAAEGAMALAKNYTELLQAARSRGLKVGGIQLDIDSPTSALPKYAAFLREIRKTLPAGTAISITAILDWFRDGTSVADVIGETDEFVPQFYDIGPPGEASEGAAIAAPIDAAKWSPRFNRFQKRFRIGISVFGRGNFLPAPQSHDRYLSFRDLVPMDMAVNPAFNLHFNRNPAGELVVDYRAMKSTRVGPYGRDIAPGDTLRFVLATPEAVSTATKAARKMGEFCAGVLFFRWPSADEALSLQPNEVLGNPPPPHARITLVDGGCAAVQCVDLWLRDAKPLSPTGLRYRIRSSAELEYFLPKENVPIQMAGPKELELSIPPFCGRGLLYLGRAVTKQRSEFTVEQQP